MIQSEIVGSRRLSVARAQILSKEFERIRKKFGLLTPRHIVQEAWNKHSPLHAEFDWNDRRAANKHRLARASELVRSVQIVIKADPSDKPRRVRALVSVMTAKGREYIPMLKVLTDKGYREQMLVDAIRELEAFKRKYYELRDLVSAVDLIVKKFKRRKAA